MKFDKLNNLDIVILESFRSNQKYSEVQKSVKNLTGEDLDGRKLSYRVDTIKRNLGYKSQIELGFNYGVYKACDGEFINTHHHTYLMEEKKKDMILVGMLIGMLTCIIAGLLIWYFSAYN